MLLRDSGLGPLAPGESPIRSTFDFAPHEGGKGFLLTHKISGGFLNAEWKKGSINDPSWSLLSSAPLLSFSSIFDLPLSPLSTQALQKKRGPGENFVPPPSAVNASPPFPVLEWPHDDDAFGTIMQWLYSKIPAVSARARRQEGP